ncbi:hypothetical protein GPALN_014281 [Globodera pallida]|nr:hypothetical protein GPALN_014281 [Globodera pallida]
MEVDNSENIPPQETLEELERALLEGKMAKSGSHEGATKDEMLRMMKELRQGIGEEIRRATDDLWTKMESEISDLTRSTAALAEALDEYTANGPEGKNGKEEAATSPQPSEGPAPEMEEEPPAPRVPQPEQQPEEGLSERPQRAYWRGRGQSGFRGQWKPQATKQHKRVNYLVRQLEREYGAPTQQHCNCWSCRRGGNGWSGRRGGGPGRGGGRGGYGNGGCAQPGPSHCAR